MFSASTVPIRTISKKSLVGASKRSAQSSAATSSLIEFCRPELAEVKANQQTILRQLQELATSTQGSLKRRRIDDDAQPRDAESSFMHAFMNLGNSRMSREEQLAALMRANPMFLLAAQQALQELDRDYVKDSPTAGATSRTSSSFLLGDTGPFTSEMDPSTALSSIDDSGLAW